MASVNFKNNCVICLQEEEPAKMLELLQTNPKQLLTFQPVVHYLTGTDPTYDRSEKECKFKDIPVMTNLPPLCTGCYNICGDIYQLHVQLLELQRLIQLKTEEVRAKVNLSTYTRRDNLLSFVKRLKKSGLTQEDVKQTRQFVNKFHNKIILQKPTMVMFPTKPPPLQILTFVLMPTVVPEQKDEPEVTKTEEEEREGSPVPVITSVVGATPQEIPVTPSPVVTTSTTAASATFGETVIIPGTSVKLEFENEAEEEDEYNGTLEEDEDDEPLPLVPEVKLEVEGESDNEETNFSRVGGEGDTSDKDWEADDTSSNDTDTEYQPKVKRKRPNILARRQKVQPTTPIGTYSQLKTGTSGSNSASKLMECEICDLKDLAPEELNSHMRTHLNGAPGHRCPLCRRTFISSSKLQLHYDIRLCGKQLKRINRLPKLLQCKLCPSETFSLLTEFRDHIFSVHERDHNLQAVYSCPMCDDKFKFKSIHALDFHLNLHTHLNARRKYASFHPNCCPPNFVRYLLPVPQEKPRRSKWPHHEVKFKCDACHMKYVHHYLEQHLKTLHNLSQEKIVKCPACGHCSTHLETYLEHFELYQNDHSFAKPCYLCKESFDKVEMLRQHLYSVHAKGEMISCKVCGVQCLGRKPAEEHIRMEHQAGIKRVGNSSVVIRPKPKSDDDDDDD